MKNECTGKNCEIVAAFMKLNKEKEMLEKLNIKSKERQFTDKKFDLLFRN